VLEEKIHGEGGSGWSNNGRGMRLYPRENIAPLVGALNSTEDQATHNLAGSRMSASIMSPYSPVPAL